MFFSRGDRDIGVAFQSHPVGQALSRGETKDSAVFSSHDRDLLEPTEWPKWSQASCVACREDSCLTACHAVKDGPRLSMTGASSGFYRAAAFVWGFSGGTTDSSGSL